ncbi:MAG TPA: DUF3225 domain-containing protein, partial [Chitinophagaceae bacterium]|nr:DUF3225 domain-containing protein [Chitinophagaceae bacterium]HPG11746.1 DUF3225 domain-containing protein [Chitinophagaceae bacterium]
MRLTKKLEAEILKAYHAYWDAYLKGDMRTLSYWMHDSIQMIGSGRGEFFNNKRKTIEYYKSTADQVAGKADMRNRKITVMSVGNEILINEECDFFVLIDSVWTFYGEGRVSTLFTKTNKGWKIIQEHGSMPDASTSGGEQVNTNKIKAENVRLKEAVKRRTLELEDKNHELEIETALERVRAVAMAMHKPQDLSVIGKTIFKELKSLGFVSIRNTEMVINNDEKETVKSYHYSDYGKEEIIEIDYKENPIVKKWANDLKKANDGFVPVSIPAKEIKQWKTYRKKLGYKSDPKMARANAVHYYSYSIGLGALSISSWDVLTGEQMQLLERFRNVFQLSYKRYIDIAKAEAQA